MTGLNKQSLKHMVHMVASDRIAVACKQFTKFVFTNM